HNGLVRSRVQQRRERHVPTDPGGAFQIDDLHGNPLWMNNAKRTLDDRSSAFTSSIRVLRFAAHLKCAAKRGRPPNTAGECDLNGTKHKSPFATARFRRRLRTVALGV